MRQRLRHQCCTRGRARPAHPRLLAGVRMGDDPARRFMCARCRVPVLVCRHCDRGQIYCPTGCAAVVRRQSQRAAGQRYQRGRPGRLKHATRTRRWRERQALSAVPVAQVATSGAQSVTHQGSPLPTSDAVLAAVPSPVTAAAVPAASAPPAQPCKTIPISSASAPAAAASPAVPAAGVASPCSRRPSPRP